MGYKQHYDGRWIALGVTGKGQEFTGEPAGTMAEALESLRRTLPSPYYI